MCIWLFLAPSYSVSCTGFLFNSVTGSLSLWLLLCNAFGSSSGSDSHLLAHGCFVLTVFLSTAEGEREHRGKRVVTMKEIVSTGLPLTANLPHCDFLTLHLTVSP